jgi:hypothetical protein
MNRELLKKTNYELSRYLYGQSERGAFQVLQSHYKVEWDTIDEIGYRFLDDAYDKRLKITEMESNLVLSFYRLGNWAIRKGIMRLLDIEYKNDFNFPEEDHLKFFYALYKKNIRGLVLGEDISNKPIETEDIRIEDENAKIFLDDLVSIFQYLEDAKSLGRVGGTYLPKCMPEVKPIDLKNAIEKWQRTRETKKEFEAIDKYAELKKEIRQPGNLYEIDKYYLFMDLRNQLAKEWNQMVIRI